MLELVVINQTGLNLKEETIKNISKEAYLRLSRVVSLPKQTCLSIAFVKNSKIQELNKTYRNIDKATDVLSFSGEEDELGDLVFAMDILKQQAIENHHSLSHEYIYLYIHGLLHLLGYDHESEKEANEMFNIQDKVFFSFQNEELRPICK